jgi:hypothetical protein
MNHLFRPMWDYDMILPLNMYFNLANPFFSLPLVSFASDWHAFDLTRHLRAPQGDLASICPLFTVRTERFRCRYHCACDCVAREEDDLGVVACAYAGVFPRPNVKLWCTSAPHPWAIDMIPS